MNYTKEQGLAALYRVGGPNVLESVDFHENLKPGTACRYIPGGYIGDREGHNAVVGIVRSIELAVTRYNARRSVLFDLTQNSPFTLAEERAPGHILVQNDLFATEPPSPLSFAVGDNVRICPDTSTELKRALKWIEIGMLPELNKVAQALCGIAEVEVMTSAAAVRDDGNIDSFPFPDAAERLYVCWKHTPLATPAMRSCFACHEHGEALIFSNSFKLLLDAIHRLNNPPRSSQSLIDRLREHATVVEMPDKVVIVPEADRPMSIKEPFTIRLDGATYEFLCDEATARTLLS